MKVLSDEELAGLLLVPTTVAEAKQIKRRNKPLLDALRKGVGYKGRIGCPHCKLHEGACQKCPWTKHPLSNGEYGYSACCLLARFGGVSMCDVQDNGLTYAAGYEYILERVRLRDGEKEKIEKVLIGHIEWADEVIRLGGVK